MAKHYHLIGIGGIGMSGIAHLLLKCGEKVSGSDVKSGKNTDTLREMGAEIVIGHRAENIRGAQVVVYSSAISEENPELVLARTLGVPLMKRAEALAELMKNKTVITVAGSHGKTTTTSLVSCLLLEAGLKPTVAVGGVLRNIGSNACMGEGAYFVAEADESDGSFLCYDPAYSIVTNIDREHLDYYKSFDAELDAFRKFLGKTKDDGCIFCCDDDPALKKLLAGIKKKCILFGLTERAHIYPRTVEFKGLSSEFDCYYRKKMIGKFYLSLGGRHNVSNALSVIALGLELGIDIEVIKRTLRTYKGAGRRLEIKFSGEHAMLIDDYAHHPTEIRATLAAARQLNAKRLIVVFQPHRYSRTQLLLDEFGRCFSDADYVIVTDIYPAGEQPIEGVTGNRVYEKIREYEPHKEACFLPKDKIAGYLFEILQPGDCIMTLGAGDIVKLCEMMAEELKVREKVHDSV